MRPSSDQKGSVISGTEDLSRPCAYLILFLFSLLGYQVINAQTSRVANQTPQDGADVTASQRRSEARAFEPGKSIEREIKAGETHSYLLRCEAGQFIQIDVDQRGSNVQLGLFGVDDRLILSLNNIDDTEGHEGLPLLPGISGVYRLDIKSVGRRLEAGRYELNASLPRAVTQQDRDYASAEMLIQEARQLVSQGTGQSKLDAISKYRAALPLLRSTANQRREATVLNNIGLFYQSLGELNDALDFYNQALIRRRQIGDRRGEAISLDHLGDVHVALGEIQKGLDFFDQALTLARAEKSQRAEAVTLSNIGSAYLELGETERALDFYSRALPLFKAVGGRPREALTLTSMGAIYFSRGENEKALAFYERALALQQALNARSSISYTRLQIGLLYAQRGQQEKAFGFLNQALEFGTKPAIASPRPKPSQ